jgi:hypothetical protein
VKEDEPMAVMPKLTVEVILKFSELERLFQEWISEQPKDEVIENALDKFLDWLRQKASPPPCPPQNSVFPNLGEGENK